MPNKKRGRRSKLTAADRAGTDAEIAERVAALNANRVPALAEPTSAKPVKESKTDSVEVASAIVTPHQAMLNVLLVSPNPLSATRVNAIRNAIRDLCTIALVATPAELHQVLLVLREGAKGVEGASSAIVPGEAKPNA